jgi:hypothetical protein
MQICWRFAGIFASRSHNGSDFPKPGGGHHREPAMKLQPSPFEAISLAIDGGASDKRQRHIATSLRYRF